MTSANGKEPRFDRSRISHKESKRMALLGVRMQKAQDAMDVDALETLMDELDNSIARMVEYIPADWFVDGVEPAYGTPGLLDGLKQDKYEALMEAAKPKAPGEKTA